MGCENEPVKYFLPQINTFVGIHMDQLQTLPRKILARQCYGRNEDENVTMDNSEGTEGTPCEITMLDESHH